MREFDLVTVESGAKSLRSLEHGQTFHPVTGPMAEARALHVGQQRLAGRVAAFEKPFVIWDVGFGAAANAIAAIDALADCGREVLIHSFDKNTASIEFALLHADALGYIAAHEKPLRELLSNGSALIKNASTRIEWRLHRGDFCEQIRLDAWEAPHAIFYDPYSPSANPGMWTLEHFSTLRTRLHADAPCLWTNYTRSTAVRATLLLAGFFAGHGCTIGEKEETTVASNDPHLIERPLDCRWLERVARSTNATPLRDGDFLPGKISAEDFARLQAHPQFSKVELQRD
jgi:tRNA U34 5-methylaminomethyl-2-thiouridine-forming methyltransferase MnmC